MLRSLSLSVVMLAATTVHTYGADVPRAPDSAGWTFDIEPYAWLAGIQGNVGTYVGPPLDRRVTGTIDETIPEVLENLDVGLMGLLQARNGRFSLAADIFWVKLSDTGRFNGDFVNLKGSLTTQNLMATGVAGYSLIQQDGVTLDVVAGARIWSVENEARIEGNAGSLDVDRRATQSDTWVDPLIGVKGLALLGDSNFFVTGWGLVGGFGVSSNLMWDAYAALGYQFTNNTSATLGFRALGVDYQTNKFTYDVKQYGPQVGLLFRF